MVEFNDATTTMIITMGMEEKRRVIVWVEKRLMPLGREVSGSDREADEEELKWQLLSLEK